MKTIYVYGYERLKSNIEDGGLSFEIKQLLKLNPIINLKENGLNLKPRIDCLIIDDEPDSIARILNSVYYINRDMNILVLKEYDIFEELLQLLNQDLKLVILDFQLTSRGIYDVTSGIFMQLKNNFPSCNIIGYTQHIDSDNVIRDTPEAEKLRELFLENGHYTFSKQILSVTNETEQKKLAHVLEVHLQMSDVKKEKNQLSVEKKDLLFDKYNRTQQLSKKQLLPPNSTDKGVNYYNDIINAKRELQFAGNSELFDLAIAGTYALLSEKCDFIFIEGDTGTGKEYFPQLVCNKLSSHKKVPLISINCQELEGADLNIAKVTLFGSTKGAYTGALETIGLFEKANGGVLFLDEFYLLQPEIKSLLLRFIDTQSTRIIHKVGDKSVKIDNLLLIFGSRKSLEELRDSEDAKEHIAPDLYQRLDRYRIRIPSLKDRNDIDSVFTDLIKMHAPNLRFTPQAFTKIKNFEYKRNLRQLVYLIERLKRRSENHGKDILDPDDIIFDDDDDTKIAITNEHRVYADLLNNGYNDFRKKEPTKAFEISIHYIHFKLPSNKSDFTRNAVARMYEKRHRPALWAIYNESPTKYLGLKSVLENAEKNANKPK